MDWLKKLLGDELFAKVNEKLGDKTLLLDDGSYVKNDGKTIPKDRLDKEIEKRKAAETMVAERDKSIEKMNTDLGALKKAAEGNEDLQIKITTLETENKEIKDKAANERKTLILDAKIKDAFSAAKVSGDYADFLKSSLNMDSIVMSEDGSTVAGLDDQIKGLQEKYPKFFGEEKKKGTDYTPGDDKNDKFFTKEQVEKMTAAEVEENLEAVEESMKKWE